VVGAIRHVDNLWTSWLEKHMGPHRKSPFQEREGALLVEKRPFPTQRPHKNPV
jgi:hypothetical protein